MTDARAFSKANGWPLLLPRMAAGMQRRLRDRITAKRLRSPGFRAGRSPRLLGLSHMCIGLDFNAGDALWLEAVLAYGSQQFSPNLVIGAHARMSDNVHIACIREVTIGNHLLCGSGVLISDHFHGRYDESSEANHPAIPPALRPLYSPAGIVIGDNVWLGDGVMVLPGAKIGDGCVVGANAVLNKAIPPQTIAVGAPARVVRRWDFDKQGWRRIRDASEQA